MNIVFIAPLWAASVIGISLGGNKYHKTAEITPTTIKNIFKKFMHDTICIKSYLFFVVHQHIDQGD